MAIITTTQGPGRKLSECVAIAKCYEEHLGYAPVADAHFAANVQAALTHIASRLVSDSMGLVLDLSVLIFAEREAVSVSSLLGTLKQQHGENEIVLPSISVVEWEHGLHRAQTAQQTQKRRDVLSI